MMYDPKEIHSQNIDFIDEYIDENDPGFDTYVVSEENFVASCQELARLNDFPKRGIFPDTKHDMAFRERYRKKQQALQEENRAKKSSGGSKKLKKNDSAQLLQELSKKKKKRGEDGDDDNTLAA